MPLTSPPSDAGPRLTTAGALVLKHSMPTQASRDAFDIYTPLDKGGVGKMVNMLLQHGGDSAHEHINSLGKVFFNKATEIGATTPLSDYINQSDERAAIINEFSIKASKIMQSSTPRKEKNGQLQELTGQYNKKIEKQNLEYLLSQGSTAAKMAKTGARGNASQLASGTSTPLMSMNVKGEIVPVVIKHSFAEGMTAAEQIALSYMGRGSTVLAQLSTSLPGALFKRLSPTVFHEVVTVDDCGTHNGVMIPITDTKSLIGRWEARTNKMIDEPYLRSLRESGVKKVQARSTMTCEAQEGVCRKCFGLMASGKPPEIGTNVGVIAAQSVSEVLTQAMLSNKHKATVGERKGNAYEQAANLLNNPAASFKDEATISTMNGVVSDIKKTPLGDSQVFINEKMHFVPISQTVSVEKGEKIRQGQRLSTGTVNPRQLVNLRGLGAGREYMADELRGIYGGGLDPRHFELIAKNLMKYVEVEHPGETGLVPGDKVAVETIRKYLDKGSKTVAVEDAEGGVLARGVHNLTPGTLLDFGHIQDLKHDGVTHVPVTGSGLRVKPLVPGLQTAKMLDPNWISRLSFSKLRDSLKESAALGHSSDIHSTDPIAAYTFGTEFGEGESGRY
jgi:DNA-directed RNA polymerase subunit beta'